MKESKERGVFVSEYLIPLNPYKINDSLSITVKSAWLEKTWFYDGFLNEKTKIGDHYQILVVTNTKSLSGFIFHWLLVRQNDEENFFMQGANGDLNTITAFFVTVPKTDSIIWLAQNRLYTGDNRFGENIIGKFILKKKL